MIHEIDLLNQIHQNADMGQDSIRYVMDQCNDPKFLHCLNRQMEQYQSACEKSGQMLGQYEAPAAKAKTFAKMMSHLSTDFKTMTDTSTSKLAQLMIEGSTMGVTNLIKQIHAYSGEDPDVLAFANGQLKCEQKNIDDLKHFL